MDMLALSWRTTQVVGRLSPLVLLTPAAVAIHPWVEQNRLSDLAWNYFTMQMQALGPVFVKLCQWVATRPDIFPPNVCDRLSRLHDNGLPHAWCHTHQMLSDAFGNYEASGLHIKDPDSDMIGCGSAAQVYRGTLTTGDKSRSVAVKVLHPRFHEMVERDFWLLHTLAEWLHSIPLDLIRMINLPRVASNFGALLQAQSDLRIEADHLRQFRRNFYGNLDDDNRSSITFPRPMQGWVSECVLVEDLIEDATPISVILRDRTEEGLAIRTALAGPLLRAFLKMIFIDNFTHGDLHPGNVFVRTQYVPDEPNGLARWLQWVFATTSQNAQTSSSTTEQSTPKLKARRTIVFLDAGIATSLSSSDQRNLVDLFRAVILNKGEEAGRLMVERAKYERCSQVPGGVDAFSEGIGKLVAEFHDNRKSGLTLGAVRIGSLLSRVLDLCRIHGVEIDPAMASIVVSTLVLEGLGRSLDSSLNLIDFALPFVLGRGRV
jgi:aarF domain-containing kinase